MTRRVFGGLDQRSHSPLYPGAVTLLHSGIVYPSERDPTKLLRPALGRLATRGAWRPGEVRIRFRAAAHEELLHGLARSHGVDALVEVLPPIRMAAALRK